MEMESALNTVYTPTQNAFVSCIYTLPFFYYILWSVMSIFFLQLPPKPWRKWVSIPVLFAITTKATFFHENNGVGLSKLLQGIFSVIYLITLEIFYVTEYPELYEYRVGVETLEQVKHYKGFSKEKIMWAIARAHFSLRGIGWNTCQKHLKQHSTINKQGKWEWISEILLFEIVFKFGFAIIAIDLFLNSSYMKGAGWDKNAFDLYSQGFQSIWYQFLFLSLTGFGIHYSISTLYYLGAISLVALGFYEVSDFPPIFGSLFAATTVRDFWSKFWHQLLYKPCVPLAIKLSHLVTKEKFWNRLLSVYLTFILTGILHAMGTSFLDWNGPLDYNPNIPSWLPPQITILGTTWHIGRYFYSFIYFPYQAVLITIETIVIELWKRYCFEIPKPFAKIIGFIWVFSSQYMLGHCYVDDMIKGGIRVEDVLIPEPPFFHFIKNLNLPI